MIKNCVGPLFGLALVSILGAMATAQQKNNEEAAPVFGPVSIKPNTSGGTSMYLRSGANGFFATSYTLQKLIRVAYGVEDDQISGGPNWLNSLRYDVEARTDSSAVNELRKLGPNQRKVVVDSMLQALLTDRFRLILHRETKEVPVLALVIAESGLKLQRAIPGDTYPEGIKGEGDRPAGAGTISEQPGRLVGQGIPISKLVEILSNEYHLSCTVLDKTGLTDNYDFTLQWTPGESQGESAIFTAIQEQLGLKLEPQKGSREILVIDDAEKPLED